MFGFWEKALRVFRDSNKPLERYSDHKLGERLPRETRSASWVTWGCHKPCNSKKRSVPAILQVVAFQLYATGSFLNSAGDAVGLNKSTVSRIFYRVSSELIKMPLLFPTNTTALNEPKVQFHAVAGFLNGVGAIDGTHVRLQAPSVDQHLCVNRRGYYSIKTIQCTPNCVACRAGATYDCRILQLSDITQAFELGWCSGCHCPSPQTLAP